MWQCVRKWGNDQIAEYIILAECISFLTPVQWSATSLTHLTGAQLLGGNRATPTIMPRGPHPFSGKGLVLYNLTPRLSWGADSANVFVICVLCDRVYTLQPLSARTISCTVKYQILSSCESVRVWTVWSARLLILYMSGEGEEVMRDRRTYSPSSRRCT